MNIPTFETYGVKSGVWSGLLTADKAPARAYLTLYGVIVANAELTAKGPGCWEISVELPASVLSDGIQTLLLAVDGGGDEGEGPQADAQSLGHLNVMAGAPLDGDLVAEVQILRAEVDLIKREFRRLAQYD